MLQPSQSRNAIDHATPSEVIRVWTRRLVPGITWMRAYRRRALPHDALAGLTVAAVIIPTGMAYGRLSGLPPIIGLYASLLPLVAYALFGFSRQLIIGADASSTALMATSMSVSLGCVFRSHPWRDVVCGFTK